MSFLISLRIPSMVHHDLNSLIWINFSHIHCSSSLWTPDLSKLYGEGSAITGHKGRERIIDTGCRKALRADLRDQLIHYILLQLQAPELTVFTTALHLCCAAVPRVLQTFIAGSVSYVEPFILPRGKNSQPAHELHAPIFARVPSRRGRGLVGVGSGVRVGPSDLKATRYIFSY